MIPTIAAIWLAASIIAVVWFRCAKLLRENQDVLYAEHAAAMDYGEDA